MLRMRALRRKNNDNAKTALLGIGVVLLSITCFLVFLEAIVVLVRFLIG